MRSLIQIIFIALFFGLLILPGADMLFHFAPKTELTENRNLAAMPPLPATWGQIASFFASLETCFKDHLGFRPLIIQAHTLFRVKALAQSPNSRVLIGKDEWLYYSGDKEELLTYEKPFSEEELQAMKNAIEIRKKWFSQNGTLFFFVVAPDKQTIYPEYLPEPQATWQKDHCRYDQMYRYFNAHSASDVLIDVKSEMLREKERGRSVYLRTDSHWNQYAGSIAYRCIMDSICKYKPQVVGLKEKDLLWKSRPYCGDLVRMMGGNLLYQEEPDFAYPQASQDWTWISQEIKKEFHGATIHEPVITTKSPRALPMKVVVLRDSQFEFIRPLLSETFSDVVYVKWSESMESINQIIEAEKPDIIIHEAVERWIPHAIFLDLAKIDGNRQM